MSKIRLKKRISLFIKHSPYLKLCFQFLLYFIIRILFYTYKISVTSKAPTAKPLKKTEGLFYFWHQSILSGMYFFHFLNGKGYCIVSPSNDGKIAGFICKKLGFNVLYGSSYKSPITLVKNVLSMLNNHKQLCVVGDGSRGPAFHLQRGIIRLAQKSNLPLIFVECKPSAYWKIKNSWDQFQIPKPFSTISITLHQQDPLHLIGQQN